LGCDNAIGCGDKGCAEGECAGGWGTGGDGYTAAEVCANVGDSTAGRDDWGWATSRGENVTREVDPTVDVYTERTTRILGDLYGLVDDLGSANTAQEQEKGKRGAPTMEEVFHDRAP